MFDLDLTALQPLRPWVTVGLLFVLFVISIRAVRRSGSFVPIMALFGIPALTVIAWSAWQFADHGILQQRVAEREALNTRAAQLTAAAVVPGSALACLDAGAEIAEPCEIALFQKPETVAGATAFVEAQLRLLADSLAYARRSDRSYDRSVAQLRRSLEADRYGFTAYVLAKRDGCTAEACAAFALFNDAAAVKANIAAQALENNISRHAEQWSGQKPAAVAEMPPAPPPATMTSVPATRPIDYPSAASIPPVSIMTEPPATAAAAPAEAPATRRPAASNARPRQ